MSNSPWQSLACGCAQVEEEIASGPHELESSFGRTRPRSARGARPCTPIPRRGSVSNMLDQSTAQVNCLSSAIQNAQQLTLMTVRVSCAIRSMTRRWTKSSLPALKVWHDTWRPGASFPPGLDVETLFRKLRWRVGPAVKSPFPVSVRSCS